MSYLNQTSVKSLEEVNSPYEMHTIYFVNLAISLCLLLPLKGKRLNFPTIPPLIVSNSLCLEALYNHVIAQ